MRAQLPFKTVLTLSFIAILMALYTAACVIILTFQSRQSRTDLHYLLYSEAEALASYIASTGRLDFPELTSMEGHLPIPVWLRVLERGEVIAATAGLPELAIEPLVVRQLGSLDVVLTRAEERLILVRHDVWNRPQMAVEVLTRPEVLSERSRKLLVNLLATGLILGPLSVLAGRLLARYALRPIERLVTSIRGIDPRSLDHRLEGGSVKEIADLAQEFNNLLARVENTIVHLQRFTTNASHELRTPVSSLRTGIEVSLRRPRGAAEYRQVLEESLEEIVRLQRVVEGLMALAREKTEGTEPPPHHAVDLAGVIQGVQQSLGALAAAKGLRISAQLEDGVEVWGHESQLQLMLINLLDNAIRYSPSGGEIQIAASRYDGMGRVTVANHGAAIPANERPYIFDRYFQGGRGATQSTPERIGGIGLDVVRWVAEVHRGSVRLVDDSEAATEFEVLLPLAESIGEEKTSDGRQDRPLQKQTSSEIGPVLRGLRSRRRLRAGPGRLRPGGQG